MPDDMLFPVTPDIHVADLMHMGRPHVIGAAFLDTDDGLAVVDPGPASALSQLEAGLRRLGGDWSDVRWVVLTHIHLDHAAATGDLVHRNPAARVLVHPRGAPHLIDPSRLLASAERLYGDELETLWGLPRAVPATSVEEITDDTEREIGGRAMRFLHTPGHASHHMSIIDRGTGTLFAGDSVGARIYGYGVVLGTTPPPEIDVDAFLHSVGRMQSWEPTRLVLTHFGPVTDPSEHFGLHERRLLGWADRVRHDLESGQEDADLERRFVEDVHAELAGIVGSDIAAQYTQGASPGMSWQGLARFWRKRWEREQS